MLFKIIMGFYRFATKRSMNKADNNGNGGMKKAGLAPQVSILICGSIYLAGQALKENGVEI